MSEETYARQHGTYRTVHESIIVAAKKLIAVDGFRAMNVIDLASEAEVSRATLYNHFRDKEAIGIALAQYEVEGALTFLGTLRVHRLPLCSSAGRFRSSRRWGGPRRDVFRRAHGS